MNNLFWRRGLLFDPASGAGAGGADDGGAEPGAGGDLDSKIQAAVELATKGLKENRDTILAEKRELEKQAKDAKSMLEALGGTEGIENLKKFKTNLEKDELGKLVSEGKHDEWFDKRTQAMRGDYEQKLAAKEEELQKLTGAVTETQGKFARVMLTTEVDSACISAGIEKTAIDDVRLHAAQHFVYDAELGMNVIKDGNGVVKLGKNGETPMGIPEWLESQKEARRHWWPPSKGAGAGNGLGGGAAAPDAATIGKMSAVEYKKFREGQGMGSGFAGRVRTNAG